MADARAPESLATAFRRAAAWRLPGLLLAAGVPGVNLRRWHREFFG